MIMPTILIMLIIITIVMLILIEMLIITIKTMVSITQYCCHPYDVHSVATKQHK